LLFDVVVVLEELSSTRQASMGVLDDAIRELEAR
jgi:hypothetical protein